ncbi:MAG: bis(5'-nucleosyl)-tetraphosphatase (symmetrical) YqeK [Cyanobacteria bacterium P01_F01_bin.86]
MYPSSLRDRILDWLNVNVPRPRIRHILGVEQTAFEWAQLYGLDAERAAWAGLLHDVAKYFSGDRLLDMAATEGLILDSVLKKTPHLIHADVGAIVARDKFGVTDSEILDAIRLHTLGAPGMSSLSCIVFLADALEPNRGQSEDLKNLRNLVERHLYRAVVAVSDRSLQYLIAKKDPVHPRTVETRDWFARNFAYSPLPIVQESIAC